MSAIPQTNHPAHRATLGPSHGYRFEGDIAFLNAELSVPAASLDASPAYALQLWACEAPHDGRAPTELPSGIKVAEAPLALSPTPPPRLEAQAFAHLPPAQRDYAMVLVLAVGEPGVYDRVLDYANYATPQRFVAPHLDGTVGYRVEGDALLLEADRVLNPRAADNLSGSLSLELWAHSGTYTGGEAHGTRIAQAELPRLAGQAAHAQVAARAALNQPPPGTWQLTLMLREWTAVEGYSTRDFRSFPTPYVVAEPSSAAVVAPPPVAPAPAPVALEPAKVETASVPAAASAPAPEPLPALAPVAAPPSEPAARRTSAKRPARAQEEPPVARAPVSLQRASLAELARVPGLNARLAAAIVRQRPIASLDELTKVRGIGDKLLRALRPHLTL